MARRYSVDGQRAVASSAPQTLLGTTGTTAIRLCWYDILLGVSGSPADNAILWYVQRSTAAGTSTAVTPQALDPGDPAATASAGKNHSADPTYTANAILFHLALNQRASHRWVAAPGGELKVPATANNGLGLYPVHASFTGNADATVHFEE